jgi:hypothetical protein
MRQLKHVQRLWQQSTQCTIINSATATASSEAGVALVVAVVVVASSSAIAITSFVVSTTSGCVLKSHVWGWRPALILQLQKRQFSKWQLRSSYY